MNAWEYGISNDEYFWSFMEVHTHQMVLFVEVTRGIFVKFGQIFLLWQKFIPAITLGQLE